MKRKSSSHSAAHQEAKEATKAPSTWPLYAFISTVSAACYANGLSGDFVHDDIPAVAGNRDVAGDRPISDILVNDFWGTPMAHADSHKSYRPLTTITFRYDKFLQNKWNS
ncbi:unnamed protein product [Acanthoscelides obtectus]|uniref:Transmembrane and TPR repeat-containing protein 3 n=1 Tax=Acanthoscelides obtectus TaxID=200917 RepID=A0A9P0L3M6_ACAOB|nr:unnamed protein product [Acanthoscelides obtectus]CAK1675349.1 Transmembrane and TPR repeat-containing protein 3 [Acanthoscelides obtectus]